MNVWQELADVPNHWGPCAVSIGVFDGVHLGHRTLLDATVASARERNIRSVAVTFDPHPRSTLSPGSGPDLLTTLEHRLDLIAARGVEAVLVLKFDAQLARLTAAEFTQRVLVDRLDARHVIVGASFRFGRGGAGGVSYLRDLGARAGFDVDGVTEVVTPVEGAGRVSSTLVRSLVALGRVEDAAAALGRPHRLMANPVNVGASRWFGRGDRVELRAAPNVVRPAPGLYETVLAGPSAAQVAHLWVPRDGLTSYTLVGRELAPVVRVGELVALELRRRRRALPNKGSGRRGMNRAAGVARSPWPAAGPELREAI